MRCPGRRENDIARLDAGFRRRTTDIFNQQSVLYLRLPLFIRIQGSHRKAQFAAALLRLAGSIGNRDLGLAKRDLDFLLPPLAPDTERRRRTGAQFGNASRKVDGPRDLLSIEGQDHVTRLEAGFGRGAVRFHRADQCTTGLLEAE